MESYGIQWHPMESNGIPWLLLKPYGMLWNHLETYGILSNHMNSHGLQRFFIIAINSYRAPSPASHGEIRIPMDPTCSYAFSCDMQYNLPPSFSRPHSETRT